MVKRKTCVFISGKGSNLKNLISCSRDNSFPIKISLVICNNKNATGINYAKKHNVPYILVNTKIKNHENKILLNLKKYKSDGTFAGCNRPHDPRGTGTREFFAEVTMVDDLISEVE